MKLTIIRVDVTDHGIFGHLSCDSNPFNCITLERHDIDIPEGTYKVTLYQSPEHGLVPLVNDVPNRSMIEIHEGNWEENSKGCILIGKDRTTVCGKDGIDDSKDTLKQLMSVLNSQENITLTIR